MRQRMVIENLSPRTIISYLNGPKRLIEYYNKHPQNISTDEIYTFLVYQKGLKWYLVYEQTYGKSPFLCPACEQAEMVKVQLLPPARDGPIKLRRPNT